MPESQWAMDVYSIAVRGNFFASLAPSVYDTLLGFNAKTGTFVSHLAKSWAQTSPTSYEFELRDDIKFHDGQALSADDVVYTLNYLIDPKTNLRFKSTWARAGRTTSKKSRQAGRHTTQPSES
ncbi:MAG: ABC transporter substrate-binding protein [Limisphaerales bacterium]